MALDAGRRAYVNYGGPEWHERLICGHVAGSDHVIATPDYDIYVEQLDASNPDIEGFRLCPTTGGLPVGLPGPGQVLYSFVALTLAQERDLIAEGRELAAREKTLRGGGAPGPVVAAGGAAAALPLVNLPVVPAAVGPPPVVAAAAVAAAGVPHRRAGVGGAWLLDEPIGDHEVGEEFVLPGGALRLGNRALVTIGSEVAVLTFVAEGADIDDYGKARRAFLNEDSRIFSLDEKGLTLTEAVSAMVVTSRSMLGLPACPLSGPMVGGRWLEEVMRQGHTSLIARHERWAAESGAQRSSALVFEHEVISRAIQLAATVDGLNVKVSVAAELLLRRLQLLEEAVSEDPANPSYEGATLFMGLNTKRGGGFVHPDLKKFVAEELGREAAILKEKRKAREVRTAGKGRGKGAAGPAAAP